MSNTLKNSILFILVLFLNACNESPILNNTEKEWLKKHPHLVVGIMPNSPPYQYLNNNGEISGIFIDFLSVIEKKINYNFKRVYRSDFGVLLEACKNKEIDVLLEMQETEYRDRFLKFTPELVSHYHVIVVKKSTLGISTLADLKYKRIAVVQNFAAQEYLSKNDTNLQLIPYADNIRCLRAVSTGQTDAYIGQQAVVTYFIETEGISNLKIAGEIDYKNDLAIASRKDLGILSNILTKAVNSISPGERQEIVNKWLVNNDKPFYYRANFWLILLSVFLVFFTITVLFYLVLKQRVKQKTKELNIAKEDAETSQKKFEAFTNQASEGITVTDMEGNYIFVNPAFCAMSGYTERELLSMSVAQMNDQTEIKNRFLDIHWAYQDNSFENILLRKDKTEYYAEIVEKIIKINNQDFILGTIRDITDRKQIEEVIKESQAYNRMLFDQSIIGLLVTTMDGQIIDVNNAFAKIIRRTVEESLELSYWDITPNKYFDEEQKQLILIETYGKYGPYEKEYITKDRQLVPVRLQGQVIEREGSKFLLSSVEDITESKKAENELNESKEELKVFASHLQTIREEERIMLAREIHDDLAQILITVKIDMGLIGRKLKNGIQNINFESFIESFNELSSKVDATIKTSRKIMSGLRSAEIELIGLLETMRNYADDFQEKNKIKCTINTNLESVRLSHQQSVTLLRIFQEAFINIGKHAKASHVDVSLRTEGEHLILEVIDDGLGFDTTKKNRVDSFGVIGMKERVFLLEGDFSITSQVGKGTVVKVIIPYTPEMAMKSE